MLRHLLTKQAHRVVALEQPNYNSQNLKTGKTPCDKDTGITGETQSYAMGGRVKRTGSAKLHKDEVVLPVALVKQLNKLLKK